MRIFLSTLIFSIMCNTFSAYGADVIDSIEEEDREEIDAANNAKLAPNLANESIKKISPSKKIFIISNDNASFSKGDFVSILINNQLVCRALVAKSNEDKMAGIKILKIYNTDLWNQLLVNKEVLILKGDDSYYSKKEKTTVAKKDKKDEKDNNKIQSDEDLYNSSVVSTDDEQSFEENNKRLIKPDNLLGLNYGLIQSQDNSKQSTRYPHLLASWGYQLGDNIWGEASIGYNKIPDYPNVTDEGGLDTSLISATLKIKYTISAPYYSYVMPYIGFQSVMANSPGAGKVDPTKPQKDSVYTSELELVDELKRSGPVFGITVLKRIVPGWFMRADLGSDIISGGLTLEF